MIFLLLALLSTVLTEDAFFMTKYRPSSVYRKIVAGFRYSHAANIHYQGGVQCSLGTYYCFIGVYANEMILDSNEDYLGILPFHCTNETMVYHQKRVIHTGCGTFKYGNMCYDYIHEPVVHFFHNCTEEGIVKKTSRSLVKINLRESISFPEVVYAENLTNNGEIIKPDEQWFRSEKDWPRPVHNWIYGKPTNFLMKKTIVSSPYLNDKEVETFHLKRQVELLQQEPMSTEVKYDATLECPLGTTYCLYGFYVDRPFLTTIPVMHEIPFHCTNATVLEHTVTVSYSGCSGIDWFFGCQDYLYEPSLLIFHNCTDNRYVRRFFHTLPQQHLHEPPSYHAYSVELLNKGRKTDVRSYAYGSREIHEWANGDVTQSFSSFNFTNSPYKTLEDLKKEEEERNAVLKQVLLDRIEKMQARKRKRVEQWKRNQEEYLRKQNVEEEKMKKEKEEEMKKQKEEQEKMKEDKEEKESSGEPEGSGKPESSGEPNFLNQ